MRRPSRSLACLSLALTACVAAPTVEPSPLEVAERSFAGTVLTGPVGEAPDLEASPWAVDVTFAHVDALPPGGEPLGAHVRHVFVERSGRPLKTRSELALGVRVATASPLPPETWTAERVAALWPGTTVHWLAAPNEDFGEPGESRWEAFGIRVSRGGANGDAPDSVRVALLFEGWLEETLGDEDDDEVRAPTRVARQTEHLVLDPGPAMVGAGGATGQTLRLLLPAPRPNLPLAGEIVDVRIEPAPHPDRPDFVAAVERARERLAPASSTELVNAVDVDEEFQFERERALEALASKDLRRQALLFLANATGAEATGELALAAEEASLERFSAVLNTALEASPESIDDPEAFGWFLECATYRWLARTAADPERLLPPELGSLLARRMGELGRHPDLVLETVGASADPADLLSRVHQENRIFLEDAHPAARVRAFDWLSVRGVAPAGYDPLAEPAARRAALSRAEEAAEAEEEDA